MKINNFYKYYEHDVFKDRCIDLTSKILKCLRCDIVNVIINIKYTKSI